jgi:hypothetical protein
MDEIMIGFSSHPHRPVVNKGKLSAQQLVRDGCVVD